MNCRYCGKEVKSIGFALRTPYGDKCSSSPVGVNTLQFRMEDTAFIVEKK